MIIIIIVIKSKQKKTTKNERVISSCNHHQFAVEATSTEAGIAAIDYMDIRLSKMSCENNELVCYPPLPSQGPMDPPNNAPACPSNQEKLDNLSCDFTAENKTSPQNCGWKVAPGWDIRQKWNGTGLKSALV